jgi:hypothetical protein
VWQKRIVLNVVEKFGCASRVPGDQLRTKITISVDVTGAQYSILYAYAGPENFPLCLHVQQSGNVFLI